MHAQRISSPVDVYIADRFTTRLKHLSTATRVGDTITIPDPDDLQKRYHATVTSLSCGRVDCLLKRPA